MEVTEAMFHVYSLYKVCIPVNKSDSSWTSLLLHFIAVSKFHM